MADHDQGPEYKVFVGGISWQMDDAGLLKGVQTQAGSGVRR
jgi:hypothetical protein